MKTTRYSCDRCGHTQNSDRKLSDSDRWMRTVTLLMEDGCPERHDFGYRNDLSSRNAVKSVLWCYECTVSVGLPALKEMKDEPESTSPTIEFLVREMIHDEIAAARS